MVLEHMVLEHKFVFCLMHTLIRIESTKRVKSIKLPDHPEFLFQFHILMKPSSYETIKSYI